MSTDRSRANARQSTPTRLPAFLCLRCLHLVLHSRELDHGIGVLVYSYLILYRSSTAREEPSICLEVVHLGACFFTIYTDTIHTLFHVHEKQRTNTSVHACSLRECCFQTYCILQVAECCPKPQMPRNPDSLPNRPPKILNP